MVRKGAGWKCPNDCKDMEVFVNFSERAFGTETFDPLDKNLENPTDSETTDSDSFEREAPFCSVCNEPLEWSNGKQSIDFINKMDGDQMVLLTKKKKD